jgi:hypothetical protein
MDVTMIVFVWAVVLVTVVTVLAVERSSSQVEKPLCMPDTQTVEHMRAMFAAGIEISFKQHVAHMFEIWVKDPAEQPRRAIAGMRGATSAYLRSQAWIKTWNPELCR